MANEMSRIAERLFNPKDKKPYIFNGKPLRNLKDLKDYLVAFKEEEAFWVASWLEYLGDKELARRIRHRPHDFKDIIIGRYRELKPYSSLYGGKEPLLKKP
ncbi:hypothetical protein Mtc_0556 [Methanocella conradii HZ254]|uniref:Uncharacterized protein n=1 Tax=Methanocella conradii (strain DSM 24694 / JCM 17849 / CGMCC 1.5162 / HZ254) TaxID=1041930 RepID=H8I5K2_METCZ|nr:hypothetical protein [Methanocella conradii]AFC99321.1 hypothetical protein Mtc_0556 [Methanocella conradii HZ254]MDI6896899.1 hypothetical protein [Methanocella conradii]